MSGGIYRIVNLCDGNFYIGSTVNFKVRWQTHRRDLNNGVHKNMRMQVAWQRYGSTSFSFEVVEDVQDKAILLARENAYIFATKAAVEPNYNIAHKARKRSPSTVLVSSETRQKMSAAAKRRGMQPRTVEMNAKLAASQALAWEKRRLTGKDVVSKETRAKLSASSTGRRHSSESIIKMSVIQKGRQRGPQSEETKAKTSAAIRIARSNPNSAWHNPESKKKHSEALKTAWIKRKAAH